MYVSLKNKGFASLMIILTSVSSHHLLAELKTWTKDTSGRVLVYRAEPSKLEAAGWTIMSSFGACMALGGACSVFKPKDNILMIFCGSIISAVGLYALKKWYHNYDSLFKPLIIIDRYGITYEGKDKIPWKRVCGYHHVQRTIYINGARDHDEDYVEISTDIHQLQIFEHDIAITWQMLYRLIDDAYEAYKELENERVAA